MPAFRTFNEGRRWHFFPLGQSSPILLLIISDSRQKIEIFRPASSAIGLECARDALALGGRYRIVIRAVETFRVLNSPQQQ
jgi:hypothetical protein